MFKPATVQEIRKELATRPVNEVIAYCMALARFKKENKELLSYLLFESEDTEAFSALVKSEVDGCFSMLSTEKNLYFTKKSLRKILRMVNKYSRYAADPKLTCDWLLYFCRSLRDSGIPFQSSPQLVNLYENQVKKVRRLVETMHEDLQQDYLGELTSLESVT